LVYPYPRPWIGTPTQPLIIRQTTSQVKISIQFNDLIARPYFEALGDILNPMECFVDLLKSNRIEWISMMAVCKDVEEDDEVLDVPEVVLKSPRRMGRRMSTAAGTVHIPVLVMGRRSVGTLRRNSLSALSPELESLDVLGSARHSYQDESFTPDSGAP
jgi:hypothetical protein